MRMILRVIIIVYLTCVSLAMDTCLFVLKKLKRIIIFPGG